MRRALQINTELAELVVKSAALGELCRRRCLEATTPEIENWFKIAVYLWQRYEEVVKEAGAEAVLGNWAKADTVQLEEWL